MTVQPGKYIQSYDYLSNKNTRSNLVLARGTPLRNLTFTIRTLWESRASIVFHITGTLTEQ